MNKRIVRHLAFWGAYLLFEAYLEFAWISSEYAALGVWQRYSIAFVSEAAQVVLIKVPMVYAIFFVMARAAGGEPPGRISFLAWGLPILAGACLADRFLIVRVLLPFVYGNEEPGQLFEFQRFINTFLDLVFMAGIAIAVKQYNIGQRMREQERLLVREKLETELNFLKSQTNPHFLFNTLNNIYSLARKKSDATPEVVVKLSKLLRFMLYEAQQEEISVEREIRFLEDYLEIAKIRYDDRLDLRFSHHTDDGDTRIAPLILIPLVENAFKHGADETTAETYIHLDLRVRNGELYFSATNKTDGPPSEKTTEGIGLKNLRRRLELVYRNFDLSAQNTGEQFRTTLYIALDQKHAY